MNKNKRYWLRGGLLMVVVYIILTVGLIPFGKETNCFLCIDYWMYPSMPIVLLISSLFENHVINVLQLILFCIALYFLIGIVLGWLYGKGVNNKT